MSLGIEGGHIAGLGTLEGTRQLEGVTKPGTDKPGEPPRQLTKGQKFGKQLGKDLSFIPALLGTAFRRVANLAKSVGRAFRELEAKPQRMGELTGRLQAKQAERDAKVLEIRESVEDLMETGKLDDDEKAGVRRWFERVMSGATVHKMHAPAALKDLELTHPEITTLIEAKCGELKTLESEIQSTEKEIAALDKLTPGKLVGKVVRTGLLAIASPFVSLATATLVAPFVPLWVGTALVRAGVYAETGKVPGSPSESIRAGLQERAGMDNNILGI